MTDDLGRSFFFFKKKQRRQSSRLLEILTVGKANVSRIEKGSFKKQ